MKMILVINPGSTSTKLALFDEQGKSVESTLRHSVEHLSQYQTVMAQIEFRKQAVKDFLSITLGKSQLIATVGRGGLLHPLPGGTYQVDPTMVADLKEERFNTHASNLGGILAYEIGQDYQVPAYIVDPVVVDELSDIARFSGLKGIERRSVFHALNQRAVARKIAKEMALDYEKASFIVVHMGGGISLGAHREGRVIDMVNGIDGEGPFTPERSGSLPLLPFAEYIIEKQLTVDQVKRCLAGDSGVVSYLGDSDMRQVEKKALAGDLEARMIIEAMTYQVEKAVGEMASVLKGKVDAIIVTGGLAYSPMIRQILEKDLTWISPVKSFPGEMEMEALYLGAKRVLDGTEVVRQYLSNAEYLA